MIVRRLIINSNKLIIKLKLIRHRFNEFVTNFFQYHYDPYDVRSLYTHMNVNTH